MGTERDAQPAGECWIPAPVDIASVDTHGVARVRRQDARANIAVAKAHVVDVHDAAIVPHVIFGKILPIWVDEAVREHPMFLS